MTGKKKRRGRKELINDELIGVITKAIKVGAHTEMAAAFAGINVRTLYKWMKRGRAEITRVTETPRAKYRKSEAKYVELIREIDHALAVCEVGDIITTFKASQSGDWKAAAWRLEHRFKDRWATKKETDTKMSGPDGDPIKLVTKFDNMTPDERRKKRDELIKDAQWLNEEEDKLRPKKTCRPEPGQPRQREGHFGPVPIGVREG